MDLFSAENIAAAVALVGTAWVGIRTYLRNSSRDKVEVAKDRAETDIIKVLQEQLTTALARADRAEQERNNFAMEVGKLNGHIAALEAQIGALQAEIVHLRDDIKEMKERQ